MIQDDGRVQAGSTPHPPLDQREPSATVSAMCGRIRLRDDCSERRSKPLPDGVTGIFPKCRNVPSPVPALRSFPLTRWFLAGAGILLAATAAIAEQPDHASREMIRSQLRTQLSVPGSLSIMHVEATKPNDSGLQTACGWFVARDIQGRVEAPKAFAMSFSTAAQVAKIHVIGGSAAQVQTVRTFCKELGIDF